MVKCQKQTFFCLQVFGWYGSLKVGTEISNKCCDERKKGSRHWVKNQSLPKKAIHQLRALKRKM